MKIISQKQAKKFKNSDNCFGLEYPHSSKNINGALITIIGRYPNEGRMVNEVCDELVYVISGSGRLVCEGRKYSFSKGDIIIINKKERFYWNGQCKTLIVCAPAFYPEQHKEVG
jgi:mannose-6-phosphate isomerase class I